MWLLHKGHQRPIEAKINGLSIMNKSSGHSDFRFQLRSLSIVLCHFFLLLSFYVSGQERISIYVRNKGSIPVKVAVYEDGGLLGTHRMDGWYEIKPRGLSSFPVVYNESSAPNRYLAFRITDKNGRIGITTYQPRRERNNSFKSKYSFCVPRDERPKKKGSRKRFQNCEENEIYIPFSWGITGSLFSTEYVNSLTITEKPTPEDKIAVYLDDPPKNQQVSPSTTKQSQHKYLPSSNEKYIFSEYFIFQKCHNLLADKNKKSFSTKNILADCACFSKKLNGIYQNAFSFDRKKIISEWKAFSDEVTPSFPLLKHPRLSTLLYSCKSKLPKEPIRFTDPLGTIEKVKPEYTNPSPNKEVEKVEEKTLSEDGMPQDEQVIIVIFLVVILLIIWTAHKASK